jgi:hypothetical protein
VGTHVASVGEVKYKVLSENIEFKIPVGRNLTTVPVSTAAQTATKCPVSFVAGLPAEGIHVSSLVSSRQMPRFCIGIDRERLSAYPHRHIVYEHLIRNYVMSVVETMFNRGAQIPGVRLPWRLIFCSVALVVGPQCGFASCHPYGA